MGDSKKIAIIGHFATGTDICDGQTVKTRILYDELRKLPELRIKKVDTYLKRKRPIKLIIDTLTALFSTKNVIVLLSINGMRLYFPLLSFFARHFKTRVYHDVIGGNLDKYVDSEKNFEKYLNSFHSNWVETEGLKNKLDTKGIKNCIVIPNFKRLEIKQKVENSSQENKNYRFCTFSRVVKEKGIEDAIKAIERVNNSCNQHECNLDIFGPIGDEYRDEFETILKATPEYIRYLGVIPFDKSVDTISDYDVLLFPTYWEGEGFPGTIIDAFSAGVPVIATNWNCNAELIKDGVNGIVYPGDTAKTLEEAITIMIEKPELNEAMSRECIKSAVEYQPDKYIDRIISIIEND